MSKLTFENIQEIATAKHGDLVIELNGEDLVFLNPLRLAKTKRKAIRNVFSDDPAKNPLLLAEETELVDLYKSILKNAARTVADFNKLNAAIKDDTQWDVIIDEYNAKAQAGEA